MWQILYVRLLEPNSNTDDNRRRELILNVLLAASIFLSLISLASAIFGHLTHSANYKGTPLLELGVVCVFFLSLYGASRRGHYRPAAFIFVGTFFFLSTYPLFLWGILLPQGVLTYALVIVMAGVLLNSRGAFGVTFLATSSLLIIKYLEDSSRISFDADWMDQTGGYNDVIIYGLTFMFIAVVSWLSNRETERSLIRARKSEKDLRLERSSLEVKVKERTKELEAIQAEKLLEINRFAEFGRVSSTLLHELANPLTSMSLNVEQLENKQQAKLVREVRENINYMEKYLNNARRQLRKTSDIRSFDAGKEIRAVGSFIKPKAIQDHIKIVMELAKGVTLLGDSIRFNQIIANLIVNAIDASANNVPAERIIIVRMQVTDLSVQIDVIDHGSGISGGQQAHIFDPFYTTKSTDRGTGLGLTITKRAVEDDFKGTITVTSDRQKGTCFSVVLPLP